jgi:hypothetical protein
MLSILEGVEIRKINDDKVNEKNMSEKDIGEKTINIKKIKDFRNDSVPNTPQVIENNISKLDGNENGDSEHFFLPLSPISYI